MTPDECSDSIKRYFNKIKKTFESCDVPTEEFYILRDGLCNAFPLQEKFCYSLDDMIPIMLAVITIIPAIILVYVLLRRRQECL